MQDTPRKPARPETLEIDKLDQVTGGAGSGPDTSPGGETEGGGNGTGNGTGMGPKAIM
jgi:hypothetical protein